MKVFSLKKILPKSKLSEAVEFAISHFRIEPEKATKLFLQNNPKLLAFENGCWDFEKGQLVTLLHYTTHTISHYILFPSGTSTF